MESFESYKLAMVKIDIISKRTDSLRFPINKHFMLNFRKTLEEIQTRRSSYKHKNLIHTLITSNNVELHDMYTNTDSNTNTTT